MKYGSMSILLGFLVVAFCQGVARAAPELRFSEETVDIGEVAKDSVHELEFRFVNVGEDTLVIEDIKTGCTCTVTELPQKEYTPGETGRLSVRMTAALCSGTKNFEVTVLSNDPLRPDIRLHVVSTVVTPMMMTHDMQRIEGDKPDYGLVPVEVYSTDGQAFEILSISTLELPIRFQIEKVNAQKYRLVPHVYGPVDFTRGELLGVTVETTHSSAEKQLFLSLEIIPDYECNPVQINMSGADESHPTEDGQVVIRSPYHHSLRVARILSKNRHIGVTDVVYASDQVTLFYKVVAPLELRAGGNFFDTMIVEFENGKKVTLDVTGVFRDEIH